MPEHLVFVGHANASPQGIGSHRPVVPSHVAASPQESPEHLVMHCVQLPPGHPGQGGGVSMQIPGWQSASDSHVRIVGGHEPHTTIPGSQQKSMPPQSPLVRQSLPSPGGWKGGSS